MLIVATALSLYAFDLAGVKRDHFLTRSGVLREVTKSAPVQRDDGSSSSDVWLVSDSGLEVRLRILLPVEALLQDVPLVLLIGGHRTGKSAVDLIGRPSGIAYAAIDYPYGGSQTLADVYTIVTAVPDLQKALLDTPPALRLAMDWLSLQPWFDKARVELVGVSLGVPFAAVAGALDKRFSRVWLIHGALDNYAWVMHAARDRIKNRYLRSLSVRSALLLAYGNSFRTADWLQEIAPRPVVIVVARNDDRVPSGSPGTNFKTAGNGHIDLIWTEGRHIGPDRKHELRQLIDIVVAEVSLHPDTDVGIAQ